jgi:hypothetical protein
MPEQTVTVIPERFARIIRLDYGEHEPPNGTFAACAMEAASYIAGEPWSDHPKCVCPVISAFMRAWNDGLPDGERTALLLPLLPKVLNTRGSDALAERRATMAADWLIRTHTVAWLRLAKLDKQADLLCALPEITAFAQVPSIRPTIEAVRDDANAAWDAAGAAAWDAAGDAARAAAGAAAWAAAGDAAWAAAGDAAGAAARAALAKTKSELQQSAVNLVERMCALTEADLPKAAAIAKAVQS